ncbi:MAG TPA: hypothetical protein VNO22_02855 [Planctomycetota bacterium]|nr:hypothetical protein [Planctomycetota bacterium]
MTEEKKPEQPQAEIERLERLEARYQVLREEVDELKKKLAAKIGGAASAAKREKPPREDW